MRICNTHRQEFTIQENYHGVNSYHIQITNYSLRLIANAAPGRIMLFCQTIYYINMNILGTVFSYGV